MEFYWSWCRFCSKSICRKSLWRKNDKYEVWVNAMQFWDRGPALFCRSVAQKLCTLILLYFSTIWVTWRNFTILLSCILHWVIVCTFMYFTSSVFHFFCISLFLYFTSSVFHFFCISLIFTMGNGTVQWVAELPPRYFCLCYHHPSPTTLTCSSSTSSFSSSLS